MIEHELSHQQGTKFSFVINYTIVSDPSKVKIVGVWDSNPFKTENNEDIEMPKDDIIETFMSKYDYDPLFEYIF